jgi:hypothetical protein
MSPPPDRETNQTKWDTDEWPKQRASCIAQHDCCADKQDYWNHETTDQASNECIEATRTSS